ncbi:NAD-dependent epimerase/dehydratase family protein [Palleronia sediminis]|uniref:NAD-dependent epimerase/dehydratase family protein n=1 Tax=Palleronia sediminis TaxID=2547833 RepID=UPI0014552D16|nr:NAD-dependent epimerase/dehydratase family protein [Palleronia sediminis]
MTDLGNTPVLIGAQGATGSLIARAWERVGQPFLTVSSRPGGVLTWSGETPPPAFPAARGQGVIVLAGAVPGRGRPLSDNARLARAGCDAARIWGAAWVFVASSSAVYGPTGPDPVTEDTAPQGASDYARAKLEAERASAGPAITALRLANVAGASQPFLALDAGGTLTLDRFADGTGPSRSYIGPASLARVLAALCARARAGAALPPVQNVANPAPVTMEAIAQAAGRAVTWRTAPADAIHHVHLDCTRLGAICPLPPHDAAGFWTEIRELTKAPR